MKLDQLAKPQIALRVKQIENFQLELYSSHVLVDQEFN